MWKEAVLALFKVCTDIFLDGLRKAAINFRISGPCAQFYTRHLPNIKQER
jgi:hypothetical protein